MQILYVLLAVLAFGILIFVHELGHFLAARACHVKIFEFSIGMGPKLLWYDSKKTGITYSLRMFPIGGYVSMAGEDDESDDPDALPKDRVCLLSHVEFTNLSTNTRMKFEIVSPHEMNLEAGKISLKSPIGAALMGKKVGEIAEAHVPSGILRLRIESITL